MSPGQVSSAPSPQAREDVIWPAAGGPEDLARIECTPLENRGLPESTYAALMRAATLWPDQPAVSVLPDADHWQRPLTRTFAELASDVVRTSRLLVELGVRRGEAVTVISANCAEMLPLLLAAERVGIYAPINPALSPEHARELVRLSGAEVMVAAGPELSEQVWALARETAASGSVRALLALRPTGASAGAPALEPLPGVEVAYLSARGERLGAACPVCSDPGPGDIASYLHTGGTTGTPKLAARTHTNEISNAWMVACTDFLRPDAAVFAGLPLFHTNALIVTLLAPLLKGQHVVWAGPLGYRDPALYSVFWKLVEHYRIGAMSAVPTVYQTLAQVAVDADISSLTLPIVGAAPLPAAVRESFERHTGVALCEGYGLTEGTCASSRSWPGDRRPDTVGQRLPYQEVRAAQIDEVTGEWTLLPDGEEGNIVLRGPNVFPGYVVAGPHGSEIRASRRCRDGWLDTGDLGSVDADGFIRLTGRAKDLIIRGGHNIDPQTIEDALLAHPAVTSAAAVGRPDAHSGEVPVAYVTLAAGARETPAELARWAAERVPEPAAAPKTVEILGEIPLTAVGKQYKPELRRRAAGQVVREVLADTIVAESARAVLRNGEVQILVPRSEEDATVSARLSAYALPWSWDEPTG